MKVYFNSTIRKKIQIFTICTLIISCEDRSYNNVYDSQYSLPHPTNLTLEQISDNEIQLSWIYNTNGIDGFLIDKSFDGGDWQTQYIVINENQMSCIDNEIVHNKSHEYRVSAFADENISTPSMQNSIVPYYVAPLAFEDDFTQNSLHWQLASGNWYLSNEALLINGPDDEYAHILFKETSINFDQPIRFIVNTDHISGNDETSIFGIGFFDTITENKTFYLISPDGWYNLSEHDYMTDEWSELIEWTDSNYISEDLALLEIIYRDDLFTLYYNGNYLNSYQMHDQTFNGIMLYHQGTDMIKFDNVKFYAFDIGTISKATKVTFPFSNTNTLKNY